MKKMTQDDASRLQSIEAKQNGGIVRSGSFAARAQRSAANNADKAGWPSTTENPSGGGRDNAPPQKGK